MDVSTMTTVHIRRGVRLPVRLDEMSDPMCKICLEDVDSKLAWQKCQECRSVYHAGCIRDWLKRKDTCPNCRTKFDLTSRAV